jgi:hypothetical protein
MTRLFISVLLTVLGNAIGIMVAATFIKDFSINLNGFMWSLIIFSLAQIILAPFILKLSIKYMPALRGGIALVTTLAALVIANIFSGGLSITGISAWLIAPFVIWASTVVAGVVLPAIIFKKSLKKINDKASH